MPVPVTSHHLLIICDHPLLCHSLQRLVEETSDLEVCGTATDAASAQSEIAQGFPDLVLIDIAGKTPRLVSMIRALRAQFPALPILALSPYSEPVRIQSILNAGATGFLSESEAPAQLILTARRLLALQGTNETFRGTE